MKKKTQNLMVALKIILFSVRTMERREKLFFLGGGVVRKIDCQVFDSPGLFLSLFVWPPSVCLLKRIQVYYEPGPLSR